MTPEVIKAKIQEGLANLDFEENGYTVSEDYSDIKDESLPNLAKNTVGDICSYIQGFHDCLDWIKGQGKEDWKCQ